ncbi:response regulator transcription factor [Chloroflexota bacterium]
MKALIIEDNADVVEAISLCLQTRWPDVTISSSALGFNGVEKVKSLSLDIIILDLNLPDIDGLEVLRQIRSFSSLPIIIVTVRGEEDDQAKGLEMGADDYIVKPFRPRDLIARVNSVLRRSRLSEVAFGLGISIAKYILELQQGKTGFESKAMKGNNSIFSTSTLGQNLREPDDQ